MTETLVEGMLTHHVAADEEIGGVEMLVGRTLAHEVGVLRLLGLLIAIAQIAPEGDGIAYDADSAIDDRGGVVLQITLDILRVEDCHVAVDEEQPGVAGLPDEEIADGGATYILAANEVLAKGEGGDGTIGLDGSGIGRTVVGHNDLEGNARCLQLGNQLLHQRQADVIVGGNEYGECFYLSHDSPFCAQNYKKEKK